MEPNWDQYDKVHYVDICYTIGNKSSQGASKISAKNCIGNIQASEADLLNDLQLPQVNLVYSLGLIEHFEPTGTEKIIKTHFEAALPG